MTAKPTKQSIEAMLNDAIKSEILGDRANTYRRAALIIAVIIGVVYWRPDVDLTQITFFGIKSKSGADLVIFGLWALLAYQMAMFIYYSTRDLRYWLREALSVDCQAARVKGFPELRMFFGSPPRRRENCLQPDQSITEKWNFKVGVESEWMPIPYKTRAGIAWRSYCLLSREVRDLKEKLLWWLFVDFMLPITISGVDLFVAFVWGRTGGIG